MLCSTTIWSPGNPIINTGCEIDYYLENWDFILKNCYWIHSPKNFVVLNTVKNPFKKGDVVRLKDSFIKYHDEHLNPFNVIEFRVRYINWPAVYFGNNKQDYYLYNDLDLVP